MPGQLENNLLNKLYISAKTDIESDIRDLNFKCSKNNF